MEPVGFKRVRPGLYERVDTPRHVQISARFMAAIRAESPYLADLLKQGERAEDLARRLEAAEERWWHRWTRR